MGQIFVRTLSGESVRLEDATKEDLVNCIKLSWEGLQERTAVEVERHKRIMTPLERAAKSIYENGPLEPGPWNDAVNKWERASPHRRHYALLAARAVIESLRAPSEEMHRAGNACIHEVFTKVGGGYADAGAAWQAMIDKVLEG